MKKIFLIFTVLLSQFAFATPLEEIFKDVEVSGTVRYRYEVKRDKKYDKKTQKYQNRTKTEITIK